MLNQIPYVDFVYVPILLYPTLFIVNAIFLSRL